MARTGLTSKQISILGTSIKGNIDGSYVDLDQLIVRVNYQTTKESIQHSIRHLIRRGYVVKSTDLHMRRGKRRRLIMPTMKAIEILENKYVDQFEKEMNKIKERKLKPEIEEFDEELAERIMMVSDGD